MSENYRIIRRTKKVILELKSRNWSQNQVVKEIGISHSLAAEIQDQDAVSVSVKDVTIEKLLAFLIKHENNEVPKPLRKGKVVLKKSKKDEFEAPVPESMADAIPEDRGIERGPNTADPDKFVDLLDDLNSLAARFRMKGYKLDPVITKLYEP